MKQSDNKELNLAIGKKIKQIVLKNESYSEEYLNGNNNESKNGGGVSESIVIILEDNSQIIF
jgi:hypothetical protein